MGQDINNKIAYITGASSGIGKATALQLAKEGVHIGLMARRTEKLQETAKEAESYGIKTATATVDIADNEAVNKAIAYLVDNLGQADILINNAGVMNHGRFMDMPAPEWKQTVDTNVFGTYHVMRAVLPQMIEKQQGDMINISSSSGLKGTPGSSAYNASKFAIQGMTEAVMQEMRPNNIRVFTLNPSYIASDRASKGDPDKQNPEKFTQPEDMAEYMVAQLKLHPRMFIKQSLQWATNPF